MRVLGLALVVIGVCHELILFAIAARSSSSLWETRLADLLWSAVFGGVFVANGFLVSLMRAPVLHPALSLVIACILGVSGWPVSGFWLASIVAGLWLQAATNGTPQPKRLSSPAAKEAATNMALCVFGVAIVHAATGAAFYAADATWLLTPLQFSPPAVPVDNWPAFSWFLITAVFLVICGQVLLTFDSPKVVPAWFG